MGESNTVVSAYTTYRHLQQYCSHPTINKQRYPKAKHLCWPNSICGL